MRIWIQATRSAVGGFVLLASASPGSAQTREPCSPGRAEGTGIVQGVVRDVETRVPLRGAEVQLTWRPDGERRQRTVDASTDRTGSFRFCEAPAAANLMIKASFAGKSSRSEAVIVGAGRDATIDLQIDAPHAEIAGRVVEFGSGKPVVAATVRLRGTPLTQVTPQDGKFRFPPVPPGLYEVEIQHVAFRSVADSVELELGTNMDVTVRVAPNVIPMEPLVVTVRSILLERYGFYERQQTGQGSYITRQQIERNMPMLASDLLRGVAGIRLVRRNSGVGYAPVGRADCGFRYYLNGARVGPGFEIDDIAPEWIEAVEVYRGPATVPVVFAPLGNDARAACGVIAIWTRSR
jgi:hypothetical protein